MSLHLTLEANYLALRAIGPWLVDIVGEEHRDAIGGVELAVHELATNSVDHAAAPDGELMLVGELLGDVLSVELSDAGVPFDADPGSVPAVDAPQVRGYGLMIIEQLATRLDYVRKDDRNIWTAQFRIAG